MAPFSTVACRRMLRKVDREMTDFAGERLVVQHRLRTRAIAHFCTDSAADCHDDKPLGVTIRREIPGGCGNVVEHVNGRFTDTGKYARKIDRHALESQRRRGQWDTAAVDRPRKGECDTARVAEARYRARHICSH